MAHQCRCGGPAAGRPRDQPQPDAEEWADAGLQVVGLDADGDTALDELDACGPIVVVVGSEGKGLSRLVRENCDAIVSIPMAGPTESLNASVAAGVVLAEIARQRRTLVSAPESARIPHRPQAQHRDDQRHRHRATDPPG